MVAYRSTATATNPATTSASSITITKPTGTVDGDWMVLITCASEASVVTAPTGWTEIDGMSVTGSGMSSYLFLKKAASEGASYTVSFSTASSCSGSITSFSGCSGIDSYTVIDNTTTDPSFGTDVVPTRTSLGLHVLAWRDTTIDTGTAAGAYTEIFDIGQFNTGSTIVKGMAGYVSNSTKAAGVPIVAASIDMTNSITSSIQWNIAMGDAVPADESWASTGISVELNLGGTWTDVTSSVRYDQQVSISRGTDVQGGQVNPSVANFTLDNRSGNFSTENPNSPYYGLLNFNTPCRIAKAFGTVAMTTTGYDDQKSAINRPMDRFRTSSNSALNTSGDLDIRVDCEPRTWKQTQVLAAKHSFIGLGGPGSSQSSWAFYVDTEGVPHLYWMENDVSNNMTHNIAATATVPSNLRQAIRVFLDIDNGSGEYAVTFYTADTLSGSYTQLGSTITSTTGTTNVNSSTVPVTIGAIEPAMDAQFIYDQETFVDDVNPLSPVIADSPGAFTGRIYGMEMRVGVLSTLVANPDFTAQANGTYSFTDSSGNLWVGYNDVVCTNRRYRHHGEITAWPQTKDSSNQDAWVDIESSGVLQREQQGDNPDSSALYRYYINPEGIYQTNNSPFSNFASQGPFYPIGYWPLEDEVNSNQVASGLTNGTPGIVKGTPTFADNDSFDASKAIINLTSGSSLTLPVPHTNNIGAFVVEFLLYPPSGITNGAVIARINLAGTDARVDMVYTSTNTITMNTYDNTGTLLNTSGPLTSHTASRPHNRYSIFGWDSNSTIELYEENIADGRATNLSGFSLATTAPLGRVTSVILNPNGTMDGVYMGHVAVFDGTDFNVSDGSGYPYGVGLDFIPPTDALLGSTGEYSAHRAKRIVQEAQMNPYSIGDKGAFLGIQHVSTLMDSVRDSQLSDGGYLYEPRNILGLGYRTLKSMYNAPARLVLDYLGASLSGDFLPLKDNLGTINDMTVHRIDGSSARYIQTTGQLSVNRPPNGIGRYSGSADLSLWQDSQTASQASWRVFWGTTNELKVNQITLALENPRISATSDSITRFYDADIGDRITISNLPATIQPNQMRQQIVGYSEVFDQFQHDITFNTIPGSKFEIAQATPAATSTTQSKADTLTTTLTASANTTTTSLTTVTQADSATFLQDGTDFDIIVAGERMTVGSATYAVVDAFGRTSSSSWGSADIGGTYTSSGGTSADFNVTGGLGKHRLATANATRRSILSAVNADVDLTVDIGTDALATGDFLSGSLMARYVDTNNFYNLRLAFETTAALTLTIRKRLNGTETNLGTFSPAITHVANTLVRVRWQISGSTLRAKIWSVGNNEPGWQITATDTDFTAAGSIGMRSISGPANTNVNPNVLYDNFSQTNANILTVTRSVNSIVKSHISGEQVKLFKPAITAL